MMIPRWQAVLGVVAILASPGDLEGQFNLPLPNATPSEPVLLEDIQMLFRGDNFAVGKGYEQSVKELRALLASTGSADSARFAGLVESFCKTLDRYPDGKCEQALTRDALRKRFGTTTEVPLGETWIALDLPLRPSRPYVGRYIRQSGERDAFSLASQFGANVGEDVAYVVSNIIRGQVGRAIFSTDQAMVIARAEDANAATRDTIESDRANAVRAINNGGTLTARFTMPVYARAGSTISQAAGLSLGAGVLGSITGSDKAKVGAGSATFEWIAAMPIRDVGGVGTILADVILGVRSGYTYAGGSILSAREVRDVSYSQFVVGLRQNGNMTVSALVSVSNHGMDEHLPRLGINFAARR